MTRAASACCCDSSELRTVCTSATDAPANARPNASVVASVIRTRTGSNGATSLRRVSLGTIVGDDLVAGPAHRVQHAPLEVVVDLPAQVADVDLDDVAIALDLRTPHLVEQVVLLRDASAPPHERLEQGEL